MEIRASLLSYMRFLSYSMVKRPESDTKKPEQ